MGYSLRVDLLAHHIRGDGVAHDLALGLLPVVPSGEVGPRPEVVGKDALVGIAYARIHLAQVTKLQGAHL